MQGWQLTTGVGELNDTFGVGAVEQVANDVIVFDQAKDWSKAEAVTWRWSAPGAAPWVNLSDVRLRNTKLHDNVVLVTAWGRAAMLSRHSERVLWAATPGGNPHAIERLPGGVIVTASSAGYLRLYRPPSTTAFKKVPLPGAHGVLYDSKREVLWTVGDKRLVRYRITGSGTGTRLHKVATKAIRGLGHDLQPVYGDPDSLWFTDTYGVYRFDIPAKTFHEVDGANGVKSYVSQPSGLRARTRADHGGPRKWAGPTVDFFRASGDKAFSRTRRGAEFYKVRIWTPAFG